MNIWALLTTNLSLEMSCLILIWKCLAQLSSQTWTIVLCIILGIHIVQTNTGDVRLVSLKRLWGKAYFMPGAYLILIIPRKKPTYMWLWESTKIWIFLQMLFQKHWNWLPIYEIVFRKRGVCRGQSSALRLRMKWFVYWNYRNNCNYLLEEVLNINRIQSMPLNT